MSENNKLLLSVFSGATESRNLEFKEGFNWEAEDSKKIRDELIKAILAMSNTPGGGFIILGIKTDTKKKKIYTDGFGIKDAQSFIKNEELIKKAVHDYCSRPLEMDIQSELHPDDSKKAFVIIQVEEFEKWPTVTSKPSTTKEDNKKIPVIEHHAIYTRSKLAQWSSIKAGPQEIEDIVETSVKKYDSHVRSLGYIRAKSRNKDVNEWLSKHQKQAFSGLQKLEINTYMEVVVRTDFSKDIKKVELRDAARESTINTFGWPIAVFLDNREEYRPQADDRGLFAEISTEKDALEGGKMFDYWALDTYGDFYLLKSIFEDKRNPEIISFNTRIVRITEVFMYLRNLYSKLDFNLNQKFEITLKHGGIKGRKLGTLSQNRLMFRTYQIKVDEVVTTINTSIKEFEDDPSGVVEKFTEPLFEAFDFFTLERKILDEIVQNYLNGKIT